MKIDRLLEPSIRARLFLQKAVITHSPSFAKEAVELFACSEHNQHFHKLTTLTNPIVPS